MTENNILYFENYKKASTCSGTADRGPADVIAFDFHTKRIKNVLSDSANIDYMTVKSIMDHTVNFESGIEDELFHKALDIYVDRMYYLYDPLDEETEGDTTEVTAEDYRRHQMEFSFEPKTLDCCEVLDDGRSHEDWSDCFNDMGPEDWESD